MKIKSLFYSFFLIHSASYAGDPPPIRPIPRLYKNVIIEGPCLTPRVVKEVTRKASSVALQSPSSGTNLNAIAASLPRKIDGVRVYADSKVLSLSEAFLKKLQKRALKELFLPVSKASTRGLSAFSLQALTLYIPEGKLPRHRLPRALHYLTLQGYKLPSLKELKTTLSSARNLQGLALMFDYESKDLEARVLKKILPHLKALGIEFTDPLSPPAASQILDFALSYPRPLKVYLDLCTASTSFQDLARHMKGEGLCLKKLCLRVPRGFSNLNRNPAEEAAQQTALHHLLSKVESLSLLACEGLLGSFQEAEKLYNLPLQDLTLETLSTEIPPLSEARGLLSILALKNLKSLSLQGGSFFSALFRLGFEPPESGRPLFDYLDEADKLSLTSLKLNILDPHTRHYPEGFGKFLNNIFHQAALTSFSLVNETSAGPEEEEKILASFPAPRQEEVIFDSPRPVCLQGPCGT